MIGVEISNDLIKMAKDDLHYVLKDDVTAWLHVHAGAGDCRGGWSPDCDWLWTYKSVDYRGAAVVFSDANVAMLFKLTWV